MPQQNKLSRNGSLQTWAGVATIVGAAIALTAYVRPPSTPPPHPPQPDETSGLGVGRVELPLGGTPGYTPKEDGNPLIELGLESAASTTAIVAYAKYPMGPFDSDGTLAVLSPENNPLIEGFKVVVEKYWPMPEFVPTGAVGGLMPCIEASFLLEKREQSLPWAFKKSLVRAWKPGESPPNFQPDEDVLPIPVRDFDPALFKLCFSAKDPGVYKLQVYIAASDAGRKGTTEDIPVYEEPVVLAFYPQGADGDDVVAKLESVAEDPEWHYVGQAMDDARE